MTRALTNISKTPDPDEVALITASWPDLLRRHIAGASEREEIALTLEAITVPAGRPWGLARIASLLTSYYAADIPASIIQMDAEDWADELDGKPAWAIQAAVRWWRGEGNPDRRKRPQPGDIAARVTFEMGVVSVARLAIERFDRGSAYLPQQEERKPVDKAVADEILRSSGYTPKRFGSENTY